MKKPKDLYIITTAMKRDTLEWEGELANYLLSTDPKKNLLNGSVKITIDSWNNIKKYVDVKMHSSYLMNREWLDPELGLRHF